MSSKEIAPLNDFFAKAREHRHSTAHAPTNGAVLRFNGKSGAWTLGLDETDVGGETAIIHTASLCHGYARWGEERPVTIYTSVTQPLPQPPAPFDGVDDEGKAKTYVAQDARRFFGAFVDEDLGQFTFETHSMGGTQRVDELMDAIFLRAQNESVYLFPVVYLGADFYKRSTGRVYKPIFKVVGWADHEGNEEKPRVAHDEDENEDDAAVVRKRKKRRITA